MGSYVFKWPYPANDVHVTGTFDDWAKSVPLNKVGDYWEGEVDLPSADEKVLYKFVVDDEWIVDESAPKEGDGHWNINNVLLPEKIKRKPASAVKNVDVPGAFPETPSNEPASFGVAPIPATSGMSNPIQLPAGAPIPDQKEITSNTIGSSVTTSKEDYEKVGSDLPESSKEATEYSISPIPATSGVGNPISVPAGSALPDQKDITSNTIGSAVTTSKEDYEKVGSSTDDSNAFSVNPIPASSGYGNPINLPAGAPVPNSKDVTPHTLESNITTSKEDYEKVGSGAFPTGAAVAGGAAAGVLGGAALGSAFSVPKEKENLIPESSLPMGVGKSDTLDAGPFISSSAGQGTTTAELASKVPLETSAIPGSTVADASTSKLASDLEVPLKPSPFIQSSGPGTTTSDLAAKVPSETDPTIRSSGPGTTTAALAGAVPLASDPTIRSSGPGTTTAALAAQVPTEASGVPDVVKESISSAHQAPEAVASAEAVKEKADLEKELLSRTSPVEATGEPASAAAQQTSYYGLATSVPQTVEQSMQKARVAPEAAADTSAVAEKTAVEQELLSKIPSTDEVGEPAPTIAAATSTTAPATTSSTGTTGLTTGATSTSATAAAATSLTDGKTANEVVPDTDTSSAARGPSAGEIAGGAVVGGGAAAGVATLAARHKDADVAPPRVTDAQKPDITTEASPATAIKDQVPGQTPAASTTIAHGPTTTSGAGITKSIEPIEASEAATTEHAPIGSSGAATGVSSARAAATSDGPATPSLANEPAVKMMKQNDSLTSTSVPAPTSTATDATASTTAKKDADVVPAGIPSLTSTGTAMAEGGERKDIQPAAPATGTAAVQGPSTPAKKTAPTSAASSPATSTPASTATEKKKKHRISAFIKKIFD